MDVPLHELQLLAVAARNWQAEHDCASSDDPGVVAQVEVVERWFAQTTGG